jgi:gluconolactonase
MGERSFRVLASGVGFTEGPVFRQNGEIVVTSIDRGHIYRVGKDGCHILAVVGGGPNGATEGRDSGIYVAQTPRRRGGTVTSGIQVVRADNVVEWITMDPVSPNDLCFGPDGLLWVTDPTRRPSRDDSRLWRVNVETHEAELLLSTNYYTNGIAFGPESDAVYVANTGGKSIVRYPLTSAGLGTPEVAIQMEHGSPDGFAFDAEANVLIAANGDDGRNGDIQAWDRNGKLLDILEPRRGRYITNLAIGLDGRLIATNPSAASSSSPGKWTPDEGAVIETTWPHPGLVLHPFR